MSDPVDGLFLITPHPPGVVETRITRNGDTKPLTLDPPGVAGRQEWLVRAVKGPEGTYTLTRLGGEPTEGFSWAGKDPEAGSAVLLGEPKPFFLIKIEGGARPIYQIRPAFTILGADYYVGHDGNQVKFVAYPVIRDPPPHELPEWRFTPVD
ncbi:hypothetical protein BD779DRAFT_1561989 [Infundibulicybe gibba]|nr:hypothetical protein BD779DRAFT_1561989 [Infundibulicybe gibba]